VGLRGAENAGAETEILVTEIAVTEIEEVLDGKCTV
jgi:hypothetical protein